MAFRDETEALRQRVRTLQESLDALRRERDQLLDATRVLDQGVEARAAELTTGSPRLALFAGAALVVLIGAGIASGASSSDSRTYYGRVVGASGEASVRSGARCTVFVSDAESEHYDAKISVLCGGRVIYGGGSLGYVGCTEREGAIARCEDESFSDDGGDPKMTFDRAAQTVRVEDSSPAWAVDIAFGGALP
jgi:hypothetical protein